MTYKKRTIEAAFHQINVMRGALFTLTNRLALRRDAESEVSDQIAEIAKAIAVLDSMLIARRDEIPAAFADQQPVSEARH